MIIDKVNIYSFDLELKRPLKIKSEKVNSRPGYIIEVSAAGTVGYGEISPLKGFSQESLDDALNQLKSIRYFLLSDPIPDGVYDLGGRFQDWLGNFELKSSVIFGIEMAILNLLANVRSKTLKELLSESVHSHIPINGLLLGEQEEIKLQTKQLIADGFSALKLKVGRKDINEEIKLVRELNEIINGHALLHVDANQAWTLDEAIFFGNEVSLAAVDYIEEPFKDIDQIPEFFHQTMIPVALDESLQHHDFEEIKHIEGAEILVLKPSVVGGIEKTWKILNDAKRMGLNSVISSIFESHIGLLTLANIAGCSFRNNAAGLDTTKCFKDSLLKDPLEIRRGKIEIGSRAVTQADINFDLLKKIKL
ncbi:MAG: o-succinylbenzoate synthase [Candidatus Omnitrophica bacterium]|nr:o-succinylbenzoate synthase [Candidatus Omnitrophota bacterium]